MNRKMLGCAIPVFLCVLLFAPPAHANVMIPVIVAGWFGMFVALVPIIIIEWVVLTRVGAHIWESLLAMSVANLGSTLAGKGGNKQRMTSHRFRLWNQMPVQH